MFYVHSLSALWGRVCFSSLHLSTLIQISWLILLVNNKVKDNCPENRARGSILEIKQGEQTSYEGSDPER